MTVEPVPAAPAAAAPYVEPPAAGGLLSITTPGLLWGEAVTYTFEPQARRCTVRFLEADLTVSVPDTELSLPPDAIAAFGVAFKRAIESNEAGWKKLRQQAQRVARGRERELLDPSLPQEGLGDGGAITTGTVPTR